MKKSLLFLLSIFCTCFVFTACDDDCDHEFTESKPDENGQSILELLSENPWYNEPENEEDRYYSSGTFYAKFTTPQRSQETEGRYEADGKAGTLTWTYQFLGQTQFIDWKIKDLTKERLVILSSTTGMHEYCRIVEEYKLSVGEQAYIKYSSDGIKRYTSLNERIASVDENGVITAAGEKGTAYIKVESDASKVFVKVVVGDDCLDLWYDYISLLNSSYSKVVNVLGTPAATSDNLCLYTMPLHDLIKEVYVAYNKVSNLSEEFDLFLKDGVLHAEILAYLKSRYYEAEPEYGNKVFTSGPTAETSVAKITFFEEKNAVAIYLMPEFIPNYTYLFGQNASVLPGIFGEPLTENIYMTFGCTFIDYIAFFMEETSNEIKAYSFVLNENAVKEDILNYYKNNLYVNKIDEAEEVYAFTDGKTMQDSQMGVVYRAKSNTIEYLCFKYFNAQKKRNDMIEFF